MIAQRDVFGRTLVELADADPRLLVLDGDLANSTKADVFAEAYPDRFLAMGIAEQNMAGVAAGLATLGFVPWISTFAAFAVKRDLDQVRVVIAQPSLNVKITGAYSGLLTGFTGKTHQSVEDIAVMRAMPNMVVLAPADGPETRAAMHAAHTYGGPVYLRLARDPSPRIFDEGPAFVIGRGIVLREGRDIAIISTGVHTSRAVEACDLLAADGLRACHLHLPTIKPLDEDAVVRAAERTGAVLVTEEHSVIGGLGGAVAEVLGQRRPTLLRLHGIRDVFGESGPNDALLANYGLTPRHIAEEARLLLGRPRR
ncbi:MAG: transketolase family protein [Chloroflexota bacterium]|nr:transketolase family protein [Chloroflexota bacterium]